jgi:DNA polymerase-3 subunit delta
LQVTVNNLKSHLERKGLERAYLVFGDEPLQAVESTDMVRAFARGAGISERLLFDVEAGFDWQRLVAETNEMSLFAEQRLIEVRLSGRKPDKVGSALIADLLSRDDAQDVFLFSAEKLDRNVQKSKWFKAIDGAGVTLQVRQINASQLDKWIGHRAQGLGINLTAAASELIAIRAEGNLLAAAQELDKLSLLVDESEVDAATVLKLTVDSARFDVFGLVDVSLAGDSAKAIRMLRGLREEGTEPVVIGWALNRELRALVHMAGDIAAGNSVQSVINQHNVWSSRSAIVSRTLKQTSLQRLTAMFRDTMRIDKIVKGATAGNPWDELEMLCLRLSSGR